MTAHDRESEAEARGTRLKQLVRRGARIALAAQVASQLISLLVLATLYRRLSLEDYGLFGVVVPVLMLVRNLTTLGLGATAVQREEMSAETSTSLFWWNVWIGAATMVLTACAAPLVAWAYGDASAGWITFYLAGASFLASLGTQHQALLERAMNWKALALVRLAAQAGAGFAAVQLALRGAGIWSLVAQQYVEVGVTTALCWWTAGWRPGTPRRHPDARQLLGFGSHFAGAGLMFFLAGNVDKLLLGALLKADGRVAAGYYTQAFNFMMRPVYLLTAPLNSLMLPALARARADAVAFREVYLGFQRLISTAMFPVAVGLCVTAPDVMLLLGGRNWHGAGEVLRALAPTILVQGFINTTSSALAAVGRADRLFAASVAFATTMSLLSFAILSWFRDDPDTVTILAGWYAAASIGLFIPYQVWSLRTLNVPIQAWVSAILRPLLASLLMGVCVVAAHLGAYGWTWQTRQVAPLDTIFSLALQIAIGVVCYVVLAWPDCCWLWTQLRRDVSLGGPPAVDSESR
ncbi:MAG: lipopolysaccharide biosynthesis protein [Planctomycetia bacterium]|nr:lipopolysaccharide biosynthesis protein [Planctomycetia bacterium]